ncbi:hypothetical protein IGI67_003840 [Enterococcus sp. AZ196]
MQYLLGVIFLLLSIWQFIMFKRAFTHLRQSADKDTSPFIMLSMWGGLVFAIILLSIAISCFFSDYSSFV